MKNLSRPLAVASMLLWTACGGSGGEGPLVIEGIAFSELFAPPIRAEIDAVEADWRARDVSPQNVAEVTSTTIDVGGVDFLARVVSHTVLGVRHYGAILSPVGAPDGSLAVLVYSHGGDSGVDIDGVLPLLPTILPSSFDDFVVVVPSFRSETLTFDGTDYLSDGPPSPWDRDVDDALALLNVTAASTPAADMDRVGLLGFSRGAGVGLLMAIRDPRIDVVVEFFGPTDFFGGLVQDVVADALRGRLQNLPGVTDLNEQFIQPLKSGQLTIAQMRSQLVRRSPVYFASNLPDLQIHHGTADPIVPVEEARRLIAVMESLGRGEPEFEHYIYPGGSHNPLTLFGSLPRTLDFLERLK